jgi:hypothetical protein
MCITTPFPDLTFGPDNTFDLMPGLVARCVSLWVARPLAGPAGAVHTAGPSGAGADSAGAPGRRPLRPLRPGAPV